MVTTIRCDWHGAMGRCAREGALYPRAGVRGGASCEACAGYIDPNRRKTVAWSPSGGRSASRVTFFDGAAGGNGQRRRDADISGRRQLLRGRWRARGRRRAVLSGWDQRRVARYEHSRNVVARTTFRFRWTGQSEVRLRIAGVACGFDVRPPTRATAVAERACDIALRAVASSALSFPASTALGNRARHTVTPAAVDDRPRDDVP